MSRATHDMSCGSCGWKGTVVDDCITCPSCRASAEGQPVPQSRIEELISKMKIQKEGIAIPEAKEVVPTPVNPSKEAKG